MPELPEVQTMVDGLNGTVLGRTVVEVWGDAPNLIKNLGFDEFKERIVGQKFVSIKRRGKVIVIKLNKDVLFVYPKMTGHFLFGKWVRGRRVWIPQDSDYLKDPMNRFIHIIFMLDSGDMLVFSDMRKFARIELWGSKMAFKAGIIAKLGIDALELKMADFDQILKQKGNIKIKQILMDQELIAGIGNIYADEILFKAKVNPFRVSKTLNNVEIKNIFNSIKPILKSALKCFGSSNSDYRQISGAKGQYQFHQKVYRRMGEKCYICKAKIQRKKLAGRSTHYCPLCQK